MTITPQLLRHYEKIVRIISTIVVNENKVVFIIY